MPKTLSVRAIIAASLGALFGALVGFGVATYWLVTTYHSFRFTLAEVRLTAPIHVEGRRMEDVAKELAAEIKQQKGLEIRYIFSPETLANEMPDHFTKVRADGYGAILELADRYRSEAELVGDRVILFMRSEKEQARSTQ